MCLAFAFSEACFSIVVSVVSNEESRAFLKY